MKDCDHEWGRPGAVPRYAHGFKGGYILIDHPQSKQQWCKKCRTAKHEHLPQGLPKEGFEDILGTIVEIKGCTCERYIS